MSKCRLSARELVCETFSPRVAILSSPAAQAVCQANGFNFTQLIQHFNSLTTFHTWQEPSGSQIDPKCLKISPVDIASWKPPVQDVQRNRQIQHSLVSQTPPPLRVMRENEIGKDDDSSNLQFKMYSMKGKASGTEYSVEVPSSTPWFEAWRETSLKLYSEQNPGQYEFFGHFISCVLVISTSEGRSIDELTTIIGKLSKLQQQHQTEWPQSWLLSSVLKFYILLHDNSTEDTAGAEAVYQNLRTTYGGNFCSLLKINTENCESTTASSDPCASLENQDQQNESSLYNTKDIVAPPETVRFNDMLHPLSPDDELPPSCLPQNGVSLSTNLGNFVKSNISPQGRNISPADIRNIQTTINEFLGKALLPYVERQCRLLHESIVNRRSMSKSFFGATKRLFGASAKAPGLTVYTIDSPEIVSRKLADLYFLFGHYSGAYHMYHQLKKDFNSDQAWIYYASALEMAAVSHFMMTQAESPSIGARSFPVHYISESIKCYMESTKMIDAAIRCTIMCCECLKELDNYPMAAEIYIRMTSEECDIRSALMLEQAAYAFLQMNSPRKFALHSVLAGHRFGKAGLKVHSLNSYIQACQVYSGRGWRFAEDHVHFTIARLQSFLQLHSGLAKYLKSLLKSPTPQPVGQIQIFYKELLSIMSKLYEEEGSPQELEIPKLISSEIRIRVGNTGLQTGELHNFNFNENISSAYWDTLEEQVVRERISSSVITFKPSRMLFQQGTDNTVHPRVPYNEYFYIEIPLQNPLSIEISLQNIGLKFDPGSCVTSTVVNELCFQPGETKLVRFAVSSSREGRIKFDLIFYELQLGITVPFKQKVIMKGPRLNSSKAERYGRIYANDLRNEIDISDQMPLLQAEIEGLPSTLIHTQLTKFNIVLRDKSMDPSERKRISRVILASENMSDFFQVMPDSSTPDLVLGDVQKNYCPVCLTMDGSPTVRMPCLYKAPQFGESACVNILVLYEIRARDEEENHSSSALLYRIIKICVVVPLNPCLKLEFFNLKALDTKSSLCLLNVQNFTKGGSVQLEDLYITPVDTQTIEELNYLPREEYLDSKVRVGIAESLNILMKTSRRDQVETETRFLHLKWSLIFITDEDNSNRSNISGTYTVQISSIPGTINDKQNKIETFAFVFQVFHNAKNTHDFNNFPCHVCPVNLFIHPKQVGKVELTIGRAIEVESDTITTSEGTKASSQDVFFIGQTRWILEFSELQSKQLTYKIAVTRPGIYNVGPTIGVRWLNINSDEGDHLDSKDVVNSQTLHSPIIVTQSIFLTDEVTI